MAKKKKIISEKDLQTKFKPRVLECVDTSIGRVCLFTMIMRDVSRISRETKDNIVEMNKTDFARILFRLVYYFENLLENKDDRPPKYTLSKDDCQKFSKDDLEELSEIFIKHNQSMTDKGIDSKSSSKEMSITLKILDLTKQDSETHLDHLFRLFEYKEKDDKRRYESYNNLFSVSTTNQLKAVSVLGDSLKNSIASLGQSIKPTTIHGFSHLEKHADISNDFRKHDNMLRNIAENNEKKRLAPFNNLSSKLDKMISIQEETATYTLEMNKIQIVIAKELKKSSDETGKSAKKAISLNYIIIGLTVITLIIGTLATYIAYVTSTNNEVLKVNQSILNSNKETRNEIINLQKMLLDNRKIEENDILKNTSLK